MAKRFLTGSDLDTWVTDLMIEIGDRVTVLLICPPKTGPPTVSAFRWKARADAQGTDTYNGADHQSAAHGRREAKRLRELEDQNARLKKLLAEQGNRSAEAH
jgi:hypothetical protein